MPTKWNRKVTFVLLNTVSYENKVLGKPHTVEMNTYLKGIYTFSMLTSIAPISQRKVQAPVSANKTQGKEWQKVVESIALLPCFTESFWVFYHKT